MAIGKASDFVIYQDLLRSTIVEVLAQNTALFGAQANGAIRLTSQSRRGDYAQASFVANISGLITRRDNTSTAGVTDLPMTMAELIAVKLSRKIGPVAQTRDAFLKAYGTFSSVQFTSALGVMAANAMTVEMLNTGLAACAAALKQQAASYYTESSLGSISTPTLTGGMAKFGDQGSRIVAWVMHSKVYWNLVGSQIASNVTGIADFNVANGAPLSLGRPIIVTDSSGLIANLTSPDLNNYYTLGLTQDAIVVENTEEENVVVQDVTGLETLVVRYQGEYAYNLGIKGFKWDTTNGGVNPTATALTTGTNWDLAMSDMKDRAGVAIMTL